MSQAYHVDIRSPSAWNSCLVVAIGCSGLLLHYLDAPPPVPGPLTDFPGPKLAGLTYWYECYHDIIRPGQYVFKIKELHARYGPIIRMGPDDISISDPDFVDTIYAPGPGHKRDKNVRQIKALGINSSVGGSIAHDLHRKRREALNSFFSHQRIGRLNPELADKISQIETVFSRAKESSEVLNLSDIYYAFCNDIVHEYCFGNSPNLLHDLQLASSRRQNVANVLGRSKFNLHFGWVRDIMQSLPPSIGTSITPPGIRDMIAFRRSISIQIASILASKPSLNEAPSIFTYLRDSPHLPVSEKSPHRLQDEATLLIMAGTYSPILSLLVAHYHLIARPEIMAKLRSELAIHPAAVNATQLEQLPYLSAIVQESHRLTFGLTGRNPRVYPDETIVYTDKGTTDAGGSGPRTYTIPPGISLSTSTLLLHTDESIFPDPWKFDPERWMMTDDTETLGRRRRFMMSFMRGTRGCIGMHLANAEITVAVAAMARWDMSLYDTTAQDVAFCHDYHVMCPRLGSKGVQVKVTGRAGRD
ncbi:cytochrome P450 [Cryphonectria parasitica EP155]|uniref:Cytochrome P450 n=1 Tax=Cryphonectria parasitica (strain ATCC 38755 / EP155) TaxID=660469 RepID=A0A9P5CR37_CRYP1|nr:cytochrome P450 [Cryphonectria parasitica EP155]KAF3768154.1 cytochrome P450 [Cryphonectria parasitica EP155]